MLGATPVGPLDLAAQGKGLPPQGALGPTLTTAIHGHDRGAPGLSASRARPQLCVSTSFGCHDGDKVYLRWDLSSPAVSALDVVRRGLFRLWPAAQPIYLDACLRGA